MAIQGNLNAVAIYVHDTDISGDSQSLDFNISAKALDVTTFVNGGYEISAPGLKTFGADFEGLTQLGATDASNEFLLSLAGKLGQSATPTTIAPTGGADTQPAYFFSGLDTTYDQPMQLGEMAKYKTHFSNDTSTGGLARGTIGIPKAVYSSNGTGTVQTLGAATATQKIYLIQHVFASTGTGTLTTTFKSAVTSFATITTRASATVVTAPAVGSEFITPVAGPVTDTFWRVDYAITSGTFTFAVAVAIL